MRAHTHTHTCTYYSKEREKTNQARKPSPAQGTSPEKSLASQRSEDPPSQLGTFALPQFQAETREWLYIYMYVSKENMA
jgi:hypothetical protein